MPSTWANSECTLEEKLTSSSLHGRESQLQSSLQKNTSKETGGELLSQTGLKQKNLINNDKNLRILIYLQDVIVKYVIPAYTDPTLETQFFSPFLFMCIVFTCSYVLGVYMSTFM